MLSLRVVWRGFTSTPEAQPVWGPAPLPPQLPWQQGGSDTGREWYDRVPRVGRLGRTTISCLPAVLVSREPKREHGVACRIGHGHLPRIALPEQPPLVG